MVCCRFSTYPSIHLVSMALFSAVSSHICHLAASVSNVKPTLPPGTLPPAVSPKALSLVHYSSSCTPLLSDTLISSCSLTTQITF